MAEDTEAPLSPGEESTVPRLKLGETGFNALFVVGGNVIEECQQELQFPQSINTFKKMAKDGAVAPALNLVEMMIARVPWEIKIPKGYEDELAKKAEYLRQVKDDMEHSWGSFIRQAVSFNRYGFAVHEKVFRKRYKVNGSKYDDGLYGLRKLPIRSQDSIVGWEWTNEGRDLSGVWQAVVKPTGLEQTTYSSTYMQDSVYGEKKFIPRKKFLHFRNGNLKDTPIGESALVGCWESWKYKKALEQVESQGIAADMNGFKILYIPPEYMSPDATPENAAVYEVYKNMMRNIHVGKQSGMILPQVLSQDGKEGLFKFEIANVTGTKSYDTSGIIARYANEILTSLTADFLVLGQSGGGSFALSDTKMSVSETAIESKLIEIQDQLNHDLVPQLFKLNGWDTSVMPYFSFGKVDKQDLDVLSKFIQRTASVGLLPSTPKVVNWILEQAGMPIEFEEDIDREEFEEQLVGFESKAGEGMKTPGEGTSKSPLGGDDASVGNNENADATINRFELVSKDDEFVTVRFNGQVTKFTLEDWAEMEIE